MRIDKETAKRLLAIFFSIVEYGIYSRYRDKMLSELRNVINRFNELPPAIVVEETTPQPSVKEPEIEETKVSSSPPGVEPCEPCAIKHLLSSKTYMMEGAARDIEEKKAKLMEAYREMQAAEEHLAEKYPELANKIRKLRKKLEPCIFFGENCDVISISEVDAMIREIIPLVPREHYFKPIEEFG